MRAAVSSQPCYTSNQNLFDLSRVTRSVHDFSGLLKRAEAEGWRLVLLDIGVDTSTPAGELVATNIAGVAQYERRIISQRTKDALAANTATALADGGSR
jgi:DNA invertase Pin-like site-specific DNA recombinase